MTPPIPAIMPLKKPTLRLLVWTSCLTSTGLNRPASLAYGADADPWDGQEDSQILKGLGKTHRPENLLYPESDQSDQSPHWSLFFGSGFRGARSEGPSIDESFGLEAGLGLPYARGVDLSLGAGKLLEEGAKIQFECQVRAFLFFPNSGPYLGASGLFPNFPNRDGDSSRITATFGLFGGEGLYLEWDFRSSDERPLAAITEFGFRFRLDKRKPAPQDIKGPMVRVPFTDPLQAREVLSAGREPPSWREAHHLTQ